MKKEILKSEKVEEKKRGRKKIELPEDKIQELASFGLTDKDIAHYMEVDEGTLRNNFRLFLTKGRIDLKKKLRVKQIEMAMKGNVLMLIWLGKNYLGQSDNPNFEDVEEKIKKLEFIVERTLIGFDGKEITLTEARSEAK